jgi:carboxylesterase type B
MEKEEGGEMRESNSRQPVVMFVHGGIWAAGSKELFSDLGASLAAHGLLTLVLQYTLFPQVYLSLSLSHTHNTHTRTMNVRFIYHVCSGIFCSLWF